MEGLMKSISNAYRSLRQRLISAAENILLNSRTFATSYARRSGEMRMVFPFTCLSLSRRAFGEPFSSINHLTAIEASITSIIYALALVAVLFLRYPIRQEIFCAFGQYSLTHFASWQDYAPGFLLFPVFCLWFSSLFSPRKKKCSIEVMGCQA